MFYFLLVCSIENCRLRVNQAPPKNNCLVVLHNFFWVGAGGRIFKIFRFFSFKPKSTLHRIIASLSPNEGANKSTSPIKYLHTSFKPVLKCTKVDNNNLKSIFKRSKFLKKKTTFLELWKLGAVYFCTVKTFFYSFSILGAGGGGQPNNFFGASLGMGWCTH